MPRLHSLTILNCNNLKSLLDFLRATSLMKELVTIHCPLCKSLDRSITKNKEKKSDAGIDESAQAERQRGREAEH